MRYGLPAIAFAGLLLAGCGAARTGKLTAGGAMPSPASVERDLLARVNDERAKAQLPPLALDSTLSEVALNHSADMRDGAFLSHVSPRTGSPRDRVERAGIQSGLVLENVGSSTSPDALYETLTKESANRSNILNPEVTHIGIGVVKAVADRNETLVATQLFVRLARDIDTATAPATVLSLLNQSRAGRDAPALGRDEQLDEIAAAAAAEFLADPHPGEREVVDRANEKLAKLSQSYRRVAAVMGVMQSLGESATLEAALDADVTHVGVGVAQGSRPGKPANSVVVVLALGVAR